MQAIRREQTEILPRSERSDLLSEIVLAIEAGDNDRARKCLSRFPKLDPRENPRDLLYSLFFNALARRLDPALGTRTEQLNDLSLADLEINQIDLVKLMGRKIPFVFKAARIANFIVASQMRRPQRFTLLDIGIGTGLQTAELLRLLGGSGRLKKGLEIIGTEPSAEALGIATRQIRRAAERANIQCDFTPIQGKIEDFDEAQWDRLRRPPGQLLIHEAYALHHSGGFGHGTGLGTNQGGVKQRVLARLKSLEPKAFVLCEPDSDSATTSFRDRFLNAWRHFSLMFEVVDQVHGLKDNQKAAIKANFFGREIEDILGPDEDLRAKGHESESMWTERLAMAGFRPLYSEHPRLIDPLTDLLMNESSELVQVERRNAGFSLCSQGESIISIFAVR